MTNHVTGRRDFFFHLLFLCTIFFTPCLRGQQMIRSTNYNWTGSGWANAYKTEYKYNSLSDMDSMITYSWPGTSWQPSSLLTCTYSSGALTDMLGENWNTGSSSWDYSHYSLCTYTTGNNFWQQIFSTWNGSAFVTTGKNENTYDQNLELINNTNYIVKNSSFFPNVQSTYSNNAAGNSTFTMVYTWDTLSAGWITNSRIYTTYTGSVYTSSYKEAWYQNSWHPDSRSTFTVNNNGQITIEYDEQYFNNTWNNITLQTYSYSPSGTFTNITQFWNQAASTWTNWGRMIVEYSQPQATMASVITVSVSGITSTGAQCAGHVTADGGAPVTARGICYGTSPNPVVSSGNVITGSGIGNYTAALTGLTPGTFYYARAYATNSVGTVYGNTITFSTSLVSVLASVITLNISGITQYSAQCAGNVLADGGTPVTSRGVCYGISPNPTTGNASVISGTGLGSFTAVLNGLTPGTLYYARAFATNSAGTMYGNTKIFSTPVVTGVEEAASAGYALFPSPASTRITITGLQQGGQIQMFDLKGTKIETRQVTGADMQLDVSHLSAGTYIILNEKGEVLRFLKN